MLKVKIYSDGASRGNPGEAGIGVVIYSEGNEKIKELAEYIGIKTNNVAEYQALIRGLEEALVIGATEVQVYADSELMVKQMRGEYKVKNAGLQPLYQKAKLLSLKFFGFQINHVPREKNKEADVLANIGIDRKSDKTAITFNKKNEQVSFAFNEPSVVADVTKDFIINTKSLTLSKVQIKKGQGHSFDEFEEQIYYILEGKLNFRSKDLTKSIQIGDAFVLASDEKCTCIAVEDTLLLKFSNLPVNSF